MPIYVYACPNCQVSFERRQSFHDEPLRTCPTCRGEVRRVYQPVGIIFKGPGFYITDSRPKPAEDGASSTSDAATSTTASASESSKGDSTKSDSTKSDSSKSDSSKSDSTRSDSSKSKATKGEGTKSTSPATSTKTDAA